MDEVSLWERELSTDADCERVVEANVDQHCVRQESQDPRKPGGWVGDEDAQDVLVTSCKEPKKAFDVGLLIH